MLRPGIKILKFKFLLNLDESDKRSEIYGLFSCDRQEHRDLWEQLNTLLKQKELKWFQRCKETKTKEGDRNTIYYHDEANVRRRKIGLLFYN